MKKNVIKTVEQFYRTFACIVNDYDDEAWDIGHNRTTAYTLAFHILGATKMYMQDNSGYVLENGDTIKKENEWEYPKFSRADILKNIPLQKAAFEEWINKMDLEAKNEAFDWTGQDMESVVIFVIRHSHFHLGELNALLNEYKKGEAKDNYADNIY